MSKRCLKFLLRFVFPLFFFGCRDSNTDSKVEIPDWFGNVPQDSEVLYASKTATSRNLQMAIDKAVAHARAEIAQQIKVHIKDLDKRNDEETASVTLLGSKVIKQKVVKQGDLWRAYILVEYPIGKANQALKSM